MVLFAYYIASVLLFSTMSSHLIFWTFTIVFIFLVLTTITCSFLLMEGYMNIAPCLLAETNLFTILSMCLVFSYDIPNSPYWWCPTFTGVVHWINIVFPSCFFWMTSYLLPIWIWLMLGKWSASPGISKSFRIAMHPKKFHCQLYHEVKFMGFLFSGQGCLHLKCLYKFHSTAGSLLWAC